jgi:hypothetical protein
MRPGASTGVAYYDADRASTSRRRARSSSRERRRDAAVAAEFGDRLGPQGLANSSGYVGKYLMFNGYAGRSGAVRAPLNEYKSVQVTRIVHDFYDHDPKRGFYGGGGSTRRRPGPLAWSLFAPPDVPRWGRASSDTLLEAIHARDEVVATHDVAAARDQPRRPRSRVKDAWGIPAMRITYKDHPDDLAFARFLQDRAVELLQAAGALDLEARSSRRTHVRRAPARHLPHGQRSAHVGGGPVPPRARRAQPVHLRRQQLRHVGAGQPTMTIQALAFRAGDHIARFARRGEI